MVLVFSGSSWFRQRIVCATLAGKAITINKIHAESHPIGITDFEHSLLKLIEKISNGSIIEIDITGTTLNYKPGLLIGGVVRTKFDFIIIFFLVLIEIFEIEHDCGNERGIGYFLEVLTVLSPFCKEDVKATLDGITNHSKNLDISADMFQHVVIPNIKHFGIEGLSFKILKRGAPPNGGGRVIFNCPIVKKLSPINLIDDGKIQKIRGVAYSTKVSGSVPTRMALKAKASLMDIASDVYIYNDVNGGKNGGNSPGFGLLLVAETTTGCKLAYENTAPPHTIPEELAENTTKYFLMETLRRGCVDSSCQSIMLLLMALTSEDINKIRLGKLSNYTINYLRHIKLFWGVKFKIETEADTKTLILTCLGVGFHNFSRVTF